MNDYLFDEILNRRANLTRPLVAVDGQSLAREARYELIQALAPLRLRPVRVSLDAGLLGKYPQATAVAYLRPGSARALDRLGVVCAQTSLVEDAVPGALTLTLAATEGIEEGSVLHLREAGKFAEALVAAVGEASVTLTAPLSEGFAEGAAVEVVEPYEVLGAEDEAGEGHHLRVAIRKAG